MGRVPAVGPGFVNDGEHLAGAHLPVTPHRLAAVPDQLVVDVLHPDVIDLVVGELEALRIGRAELVDAAVVQPKAQIGLPLGIGHPAAVGVDDPAVRLAPEVVDRDVPEPPGGGVDPARPEEVLRRRHLVDDLLAELEGGLLPADVDQQAAQPGVGPWQDLVYEYEVERRHEDPPRQHRREDLIDADPAGPHGGDLVVGGQVAEGVQHRQQDSHRQRHGDDERQAQHEDFSDHPPRQSLADQGPELLGDLAQEHETRQRPEREQKRGGELAKEVTTEQAHDG